MEACMPGTYYEGHRDAPFADSVKRAVMKAPPKSFRVEFLPCVKSSSSYVHGLRVIPQIGSASSVSSGGSAEYDIWRRWEDALHLYECLGEAYKRAALSKRRALKKGKGVKDFNGLYKQDFASSWDSLPAGPDPESVSEDIEKVLPKLSKRGSIFRPSLSQIQARHAEFKVFLDALFSSEMPVLIKELRKEKVCLDFFGLWRRDYDLLKKTNPRHALVPSVFNSYFTPNHARPSSNPSVASFLSSSAKNPRNFSSSPPTKSRRRLSIESDDATTLAQPSVDIPRPKTPDAYYFTRSKSSAASSFSETTLCVYDTPSAYLTVTLEGCDDEPRIGRLETRQPDQPRPRASTLERKANRRKQFFGLDEDFDAVQTCVVTPESDSVHDDRRQSTSTITIDDTADYLQVMAASEARQSISTIGSAADYLQGIDFLSPSRPDDQNDRYSVSTFLTMNSAEAVIGSTQIDRSVRASVPVSLSEFEMFHDEDDDLLSATLDEFPRPISSLPPLRPIQRSVTEHSYHAFPPSPTYSNVSSIQSPVTPSGSINVKVAFDDAIIVIRIDRDTTLNELRDKVHTKFVGQEGIALPEAFGFIFTAAALTSPTSAKQFIPQDADELDTMVVIQSERHWYHLVSTFGGGKLNLRVTPQFA